MWWYRQAGIDMNYWISPDGTEIPAPGVSHSGVAAGVMLSRGVEMDPTLALQRLIKEGWIRVSYDMFELRGFSEARKTLIVAFVQRHREYYETQPDIEIDDVKRGYSQRVPTESLLEPEAKPVEEEMGFHFSLAEKHPKK